MGPRALVFWSAAAVVSTAAAVTASLEATDRIADAAQLDEPVFAELVAAPENAAAIVVREGETTIRVERGEEGWIVPDRWNYAADAEAVRALVTGLADLRFAAPRTGLPERFARLEVDAPGPDSEAKRVTVEAGDGTVLADAIIGKRSQAITGTRRGTYLRLPAGEHAWLASGTVDIATDVADWLDTDLPSMDRDDLETLVVAPAEGEGFTVGRLEREDDLTLVDQVPAGRAADAAAIRRLASVFDALRFEDLRPASEVDWPAPVTRLEATAFDDATMTAELATIGEDRWVRFGEEAAWVYRLPNFQVERMEVDLEDLLQAPEAS